MHFISRAWWTWYMIQGPGFLSLTVNVIESFAICQGSFLLQDFALVFSAEGVLLRWDRIITRSSWKKTNTFVTVFATTSCKILQATLSSIACRLPENKRRWRAWCISGLKQKKKRRDKLTKLFSTFFSVKKCSNSAFSLSWILKTVLNSASKLKANQLNTNAS